MHMCIFSIHGVQDFNIRETMIGDYANINVAIELWVFQL